MIKVVGKLLVLGLVSLTSLVYAGDDPVNCQTVTEEVAVYYGTARCTATSGSQTRDLTEYFSNSYTPVVFLSQGVFSCRATLPFVTFEQVDRTVCEYTPEASIRSYVSYDGTAYTAWLRLVSNATDRDGVITQTQWWVNGSYYGSSVPTLSVNTPTFFNVRQKVTDDDGHTDETTRSIYVSPQQDPCFEGIITC